MPPLHDNAKKLLEHEFTEEGGSEYSATSFGGFGEYFANKMVKLQNQVQEANLHLGGQQSDIFKDCVIYITGYTSPPAQELKRLITLNGGIMCHYLAGKTYATHIIATNLTARKTEQYAKYKVVKPEWIVDSVTQGKKLTWHNYRTVQVEGNLKVAKHVPAVEFGADREREIDCLDPRFIKRYYESSRLHHLSAWKGELKRRFQVLAQKTNSQNSSQSSQSTDRVIMHVDFDSFFVAVSLLKRPELKDKPVCVSNSKTESGNGDVASCNYIARRFGVKNGMWLSQARKLCPDLQSLPYDFEAYERASTALYECLVAIKPDLLFPVSVDEALLDVTSLCSDEQTALDVATRLRQAIFQQSSIEASVGMGPNVMLAKMALKLAKPPGARQYFISHHNKLKSINDMLIAALPGVGRSITSKFSDHGVYSISELREMELAHIQKLVGGTKMAKKLYEYARGIDHTSIAEIPPPKSVGVEIAWGVRLSNADDVAQFVTNLSDELATRMRSQDLSGKQLTLKLYKRRADAPTHAPKFLGHGLCDIFSKSSMPFSATNDSSYIAECAISLIRSLNCPPLDVRGIGLQMAKLDGSISGVPDTPATPTTNRVLQFGHQLPITSPRKFQQTLQLSPQRRRGQATLTQPCRSASPMPLALDAPPPPNVDAGVWSELPDDIKRELLAASRNSLAPAANATPAAVPTVMRQYVPVVFAAGADVEAMEYRDVRNRLTDWVESSVLPHFDDLCIVEKYLLETAATDFDWSKSLRLLKHMSRTVRRCHFGDNETERVEWTEILAEFESGVRNALSARGIIVDY